MVQGSGIDAPLNETGRQQASAFFQFYGHILFERIYVSNLKRTTETVQGFIDLGIPVESLSGLNEISWGTQEGVAFTPESATEYQRVVKEWQKGNLDVAIEGGENPKQVEHRQRAAFEQISATNESPVLVCMHGRAMRVLFSWMLNYSLACMDNFHHTNTGLYVLNYTGRHFTIEEFNNLDHLKK